MPEHRGRARDTVSAIIAVCNGERFLADAMRSVLNQLPPVLELVVVDDGSTDGTPGLVRAFAGARYVRQDNAGQAAALNHGVRLAAGTLLAFCDADDLWLDGRLSWQCAALEADPALEVVFGHAEQILEPDAPAAVAAALTEARRVMRCHLPGAMLIRRPAFDRVGPFAAGLRIGAVVDWYHRARQAGVRERMLEQVVLRRRLHGANLGLQLKDAAPSAYLSVVKAALDRRRAGGGAA